MKQDPPADAGQPFIQLFSNDLEADFVRRPNRFLVIASHNGKEIPCHCPNPGRLIEFFGFRGQPECGIPGIRLILERRKGPTNPKIKTEYTLAGLYYKDSRTSKTVVVPLFSSRANAAAELFLKQIIPGLKEVRMEYTIGSSRFDFYCTDNRGRPHLVEIKACSLVEYGTAMFPDAPSERALKHLEELAELASEGPGRRIYRCHVVFVIVHSEPLVFIPNLHTDPALVSGLSRLCGPGKPVSVHAVLLRADSTGRTVMAKARVPVDLSHGRLAESNGGNYLIVLELAETAETEVGNLKAGKKIRFDAGWYVYAGSARKNLQSRINRHLRKRRKQKHWHLDYLVPFAAGPVRALPFLSYRNLECALSRDLLTLGGKPIAGFGSSDCKNKCPSHLYYFSANPLQNRAFVDMIFRYRHVEALKKQ